MSDRCQTHGCCCQIDSTCIAKTLDVVTIDVNNTIQRTTATATNKQQQQEQQQEQIERAIQTRDIWSLRSIALSCNGFINDTYRQQVWPILLENQTSLSLSNQPQFEVDDRTRTERDVIHNNDTVDVHNEPEVKSYSSSSSCATSPTSKSPVLSSSSSSSMSKSPCTVMTNLLEDEYDNDDIMNIVYHSPSTHSNEKDSATVDDDDHRIMWYDLHRWYPSSSSSTSFINIDTYRQLMAHVITKSLQQQEQVLSSDAKRLRYYQGYHILVGTVLSTFVGHHETATPISARTGSTPEQQQQQQQQKLSCFLPEYTTTATTELTYATNDTIQFLQQFLQTIPHLHSIIHDADDDDQTHQLQQQQQQQQPFSWIIQYIRQYIIPLYLYCTYMNDHHQPQEQDQKHGKGAFNDKDYVDTSCPLDEEQIIGLCISWLLTLFGNNACSIEQHQRYIDVLLATNITYFPIYSCVVQLLFYTNSMNTSQLCVECKIRRTIHLMEEIPPYLLHHKVQSWWLQNYGNSKTNNDDWNADSIDDAEGVPLLNLALHQPFYNLSMLQYMYYCIRYPNVIIALGIFNIRYYKVRQQVRRLHRKIKQHIGTTITVVVAPVLQHMVRFVWYTMIATRGRMLLFNRRNFNNSKSVRFIFDLCSNVQRQFKMIIPPTKIAIRTVTYYLLLFIKNATVTLIMMMSTIGNTIMKRTINYLLVLSSHRYKCLLQSKQ